LVGRPGRGGRRRPGPPPPDDPAVTCLVVTDSAAALPAPIAADAGIVAVPMWLTIGGTPVRDGELSLADVLNRADEGVTTAGPSLGEFVQASEQAIATACPA